MPIRRTRKTKRTTRKRRVTSRKARPHARKAPIRSMNWRGSPFPEVMNTTFTYSEIMTITSTSGVPYNYLFSSNSLYDPNVTGVGTQPRFYDTLVGANNTAAPYQYYRVFSSKITIEAFGLDDALNARGFLGIGFFNTSATGVSSLAEMRQRVDFKTKFVGLYTGGHDLTRMSRVGVNKYLWGIKDMKDDEETAAAYNASPAKGGRWCISWCPANEATTQNIRVLVKIVYKAQLFSRNDVSDS